MHEFEFTWARGRRVSYEGFQNCSEAIPLLLARRPTLAIGGHWEESSLKSLQMEGGGENVTEPEERTRPIHGNRKLKSVASPRFGARASISRSATYLIFLFFLCWGIDVINGKIMCKNTIAW